MIAEDVLEEKLLRLGKQEVEASDRLDAIKARARVLVAADRVEEADPLWAAYEEGKLRLRSLQATIYEVENQLYGLRRRLRR